MDVGEARSSDGTAGAAARRDRMLKDIGETHHEPVRDGPEVRRRAAAGPEPTDQRRHSLNLDPLSP
ncbi:hypothetical protein BGLA2_990053 [Burkholderia gladioli]|nr:hypothetical protein BGLA2_990053 [Burkholderia gladioli]